VTNDSVVCTCMSAYQKSHYQHRTSYALSDDCAGQSVLHSIAHLTSLGMKAQTVEMELGINAACVSNLEQSHDFCIYTSSHMTPVSIRAVT
jgi:hypothetical protein